MTAIDVRRAEERDVETIAGIYVNAARVGWAHIFDKPSLQTLKPPVDRLRAEVASNDLRQQVLGVTAWSGGRSRSRPPTPPRTGRRAGSAVSGGRSYRRAWG
jgi:hypothetical protein